VVGSIGVLSILSILSYNVLDELRFGDRNFNDVMDYFSNQVLLPLGGLLIAIFAGWFMRREFSRDEFTTSVSRRLTGWRFLIRFVVPPALLVIFVMGVSG
jgi:NSS family neurotransmitter:Na+ symporter